MAYRRSRRARRGGRSSVKRRRTSRRFSKKGRSSNRSASRYRRSRKGSGAHKRLSVQRLKTVFPDIALSKLIGHQYYNNVPAIDASVSGVVSTTNTNNSISIGLNSIASDFWYYVPQIGVTAATQQGLNPIQTYVTKYKTYRCHGCKVIVTLTAADKGTEADGTVNNAAPLVLFGFPFQDSDPNKANYWNGSTAGYTYETVPQMKYGFRKILPGMGGKSSITYTTYWSVPKIFGDTDAQWMADDDYLSYVNVGTGAMSLPVNRATLAMFVCDMNTSAVRGYNVDWKVTQYGRWEGQQADII